MLTVNRSNALRPGRNVVASLLPLAALLLATSVAAQPTRQDTERRDPFLDTLQARTFDFFWETTNPENGLTPDHAPSKSFSSIAAVGFALTAYPIGVERGYVTRHQARRRTLTTLRFFRNAPQGSTETGVTGHRGFFYHFLNMDAGRRYKTTELSTIDTALLMAGVLTAQEYFDRDHSQERRIRALADSLYRRVEWDWMQLPSGRISMGWRPSEGRFDYGYEGYDEAMILYLLALGSPTHPVGESAWPAFTSTYRWGAFYGYEHVNFGPLFGHQYSHVWVDFRGIRDGYMREKGIDYFENSRRAVLAQRAYAIDNPGDWTGYGENVWGLTACDGPANATAEVGDTTRRFHMYWARGASLKGSQFKGVRDDGTIAPTAAGGSIPFAPEITVRALQTMKQRYGDHLWGEYGFRDAFNPTFAETGLEPEKGRVVEGVGWFDDGYLGIDQGPIVAMIENHRSGMIWKLMRQNPHIRRGLKRAGFTGGWLDR
jgi:hypothetical protein